MVIRLGLDNSISNEELCVDFLRGWMCESQKNIARYPKYMGVSKNSGTPKWMVKIMENPMKMDDLGGKPTSFGNIHIVIELHPTTGKT